MGQIVEFRRRKDDFVRPARYSREAAILERRLDASRIAQREVKSRVDNAEAATAAIAKAKALECNGGASPLGNPRLEPV
jgi:hypothetical protein